MTYQNESIRTAKSTARSSRNFYRLPGRAAPLEYGCMPALRTMKIPCITVRPGDLMLIVKPPADKPVEQAQNKHHHLTPYPSMRNNHYDPVRL